MATLAFFVLAVLAIVSAVVVITHRNPVISAMALAFNLVSIAGFYLLLQAQFIGLLQILVYAGAIMVLILFVVMLLNLRHEPASHRGGLQRWLAILLTAGLVYVLGRAIWTEHAAFPAAPAGFGTVENVGQALFRENFYPFEVISLLLVAAMVGAVLLAKRRL